jgi:AcrR family transcriptional regulator
LLAAAHDLFIANGWAATGMRDIASAAGVATETLYAHFSSKRVLFKAVTDLAVVGDDAPLAVAERSGFAAMARGSHADRTSAAARLVRGIYERTAPFAKVMREAAATDDELAAELTATRERQRRDVAAAAELIMGRPASATERDGIWAVTSPEVYLLLTEGSAWTADQYEEWMAETLARIIPRRTTSGRGPR